MAKGKVQVQGKPATAAGKGKPTIAMALLLAGGLVILLSGVGILYLSGSGSGSFLTNITSMYKNISYPNGTIANSTYLAREVSSALAVEGMIGLAMGILVILCGAMVYRNPERARIWGIAGLIFSLGSFFGGSGIIIGMILGIIGGIMAIVYRSK